MLARLLTFVLMIVLGASCSTVFQHADNVNPCSSGDKTECEHWRKKFPKEYDRYKERIRKSAEVTSSRSTQERK